MTANFCPGRKNFAKPLDKSVFMMYNEGTKKERN